MKSSMSSSNFKVIVCAIIENDDGKILIARRAPNKILGGFWEFPGGKLESGEELITALKRELDEELAITIRNPQLLLVKPHSYPHGDVLILFYHCRLDSGMPTLVDHDACEWINPGQLVDWPNLLPANREVISSLCKTVPAKS